MAFGLSVARGGEHYRIAPPGWVDPLDTSYSLHAGGRWNEAGSFGALYLNDSIPLARLQAKHKLAGLPYGIEDLDPSEQHVLVIVDVAEMDMLDGITDRGLQAVGLPDSYPRDTVGDEVPWSVCQPVGQAAFNDRRPGVACRSAATGAVRTDEELAVFETHTAAVTETGRLSFDEWYWA